MEKYIIENIKARFELRCRRCGSTEVYFDFCSEHHFSDVTVDPPSVSFNCLNCNEMVLEPLR